METFSSHRRGATNIVLSAPITKTNTHHPSSPSSSNLSTHTHKKMNSNALTHMRTHKDIEAPHHLPLYSSLSWQFHSVISMVTQKRTACGGLSTCLNILTRTHARVCPQINAHTTKRCVVDVEICLLRQSQVMTVRIRPFWLKNISILSIGCFS